MAKTTRNQKHFNVLKKNAWKYLKLNSMKMYKELSEIHNKTPLEYTSRWMKHGEQEHRERLAEFGGRPVELPDLGKCPHSYDDCAYCEILGRNKIKITIRDYVPARNDGFMMSSGYYNTKYEFIVTVPERFLHPYFKKILENMAYDIQKEEDQKREDLRIQNRRQEIFDELFSGKEVTV